SDRIEPWGFCHKCIIRDPIEKRLRKKFKPKLLLLSDNDKNTPVTLPELQKQLKNLELFLREYVIDNSYQDTTATQETV
ncbi:10906_t:CDS:1, partial [Ambispora leptoticha]